MAVNTSSDFEADCRRVVRACVDVHRRNSITTDSQGIQAGYKETYDAIKAVGTGALDRASRPERRELIDTFITVIDEECEGLPLSDIRSLKGLMYNQVRHSYGKYSKTKELPDDVAGDPVEKHTFDTHNEMLAALDRTTWEKEDEAAKQTDFIASAYYRAQVWLDLGDQEDADRIPVGVAQNCHYAIAEAVREANRRGTGMWSPDLEVCVSDVTSLEGQDESTLQALQAWARNEYKHDDPSAITTPEEAADLFTWTQGLVDRIRSARPSTSAGSTPGTASPTNSRPDELH